MSQEANVAMEAPVTADCPSAETLHDFTDGRLDESSLLAVADHLERCAICVTRLATPPSSPGSDLPATVPSPDHGDTFIDQLKRIHQDGTTPWTAFHAPAGDVANTRGSHFFHLSTESPTRDPEVFFDALASSGLANAAEIAALRKEWKAFRTNDLVSFAHNLVMQQRYTEFQIRQLLRGKTQGWKLGEYVVMHPLGAGGMGGVYRAFQRRLNRTVVLKIVPSDSTRALAAIKRLRLEIESVKTLRHPRLVTPLEAGEVDGVCFLTLQELEGHSLAEWVELNGPMRTLSAVDMIRQAAEGLAVAHDAGIIHRDIKPSNIWVETYSTSRQASKSTPGVKILNFGLAHLNAASEASAGTLGYRAPEQAVSDADERSDLFALGCTLCFLLTGKGPYDWTPTHDSSIRQNPETIPPLVSPREPIPAGLQTIYQRMIAWNPTKRYPSMDELILDLDAFLAGTKISSRWPRSLTLAAAGVALVGLMFVIGWIATRPPAPRVASADGAWRIQVDRPLPPGINGPMAPSEAAVLQKKWADALGIPIEITAAGIHLRLIPPGTMTLGTPNGQIADRLARLVPGGREWSWLRRYGGHESPSHRVSLPSPYYLATTEITVGQFRHFLEQTGHVTDAEANGLGGVTYSKGQVRRQNPGLTWRSPGFTEFDDAFPVVQVTHADAEAFCRWLSRVEKRKFHLPTEAQWEFACRAGSSDRWFWGADPVRCQDHVAEPIEGAYGPRTVASKRPNALGLYDMSGNVAEWCADWFVENPIIHSDVATDPKGPANGETHVVRGGAFLHPIPDGVASSSRLPAPDLCQDFVGFRVALELQLQTR